MRRAFVILCQLVESPAMQTMIPAITIKAALAGFGQLVFDTEALLTATGVDRAALADPFGAVPNDAFGLLWMAAFRQRPDPTLPTQVGLAVPFNEFGILDHLVTTAETVGEGLHMLNLFLWLAATNMSLRFTHGGEDWVWVENHPPEVTRFISEQWTLALIGQRFRSLMPPFTVEEVHLAQSAPGEEAHFAELWGVPVRLGQPGTGLRLASGIWQQANAQANPHLQLTLRTVAEQVVITEFEEAPLVFAIRTHLPAALQRGAFSAEDIAEELGLSKRTLQRQLAAESTTFRDLLDIYRQEQALSMLREGERDLANVAYSLGYNEQSSFIRAFRRWTGTSPSRWLK